MLCPCTACSFSKLLKYSTAYGKKDLLGVVYISKPPCSNLKAMEITYIAGSIKTIHVFEIISIPLKISDPKVSLFKINPVSKLPLSFSLPRWFWLHKQVL